MAWIQVDDGIREHDKIYNLADTLGISNAYAVGLMVCFWTWAVTAAPDGDVTNFPPRAIAKAAGWDKGGAKGAQTFYDALIRIRFLDKADDRILIRNWEQRAMLLIDYIEHQKENTRKRVQKCRERKRKKETVTVTAKHETVTPCNSNGNVTETLCNGTTSPIPKSTLPNVTPPPPVDKNADIPAEEKPAVGGAGNSESKIITEFRSSVTAEPSEKDMATLGILIRDYPEQRILDAIGETARCHGHSAAYVRSVLLNDKAGSQADHRQGKDAAEPDRGYSFDIEEYERTSVNDTKEVN